MTKSFLCLKKIKWPFYNQIWTEIRNFRWEKGQKITLPAD